MQNRFSNSAVAVIVCIAIVATVLFSATAAYIVGDVNSDSTVDLGDCQALREALIRGDSDRAYDVNHDGLVDIRDLVELHIAADKMVNSQKFETKFVNSDTYTYRVGNSGAVKLGTLFGVAEGYEIEKRTVKVTVESQTPESGLNWTIDTSAGNWEDYTIDFNGVGVADIIISDVCIPTRLTVEVVDAVNTTVAMNATENDVVLLSDCGFSTIDVSNGHTIYGNGFTMTCSSDAAALDFSYYFVSLSNGTLDNVQIVCPNYDYAALYKSNLTSDENRKDVSDRTRYYNAKSGVIASGNSRILNSRISGGRASLNVSGGDVVVENSRIERGAVATILVGAANSLTLRDVTLIQKPTVSTYDSSKTLMGFSVLYLCDADGNATPTTIEGDFVQQAWVSENESAYVPSAGGELVSTFLTATDYLHDVDGDGVKESLNLGFAYMPEDASKTVDAPTNIVDERTNKETIPYELKDVKISISILSTTVYVYSYKNTNDTDETFLIETDYTPSTQSGNITLSYNDSKEGLSSGKTFETEGWVYELNVDLDKAAGYAVDFSKLTMSVNGRRVTDFTVNGEAKPTEPVAVSAGGTVYTLGAVIEGKTYTASFKVIGTETTKESPSKISGPTSAGFGVAKSYGGDWSGAADVLSGIQIRYWSVADKTYKVLTSDDIVLGGTGKLNGTNSYWEYTPANKDFTLKVTNTATIHSGNSIYGMPIGGTDGKLYFTISSTNGYVGSGTTSRSIAMQYEFTDNNGGEKLVFTHTFNIQYNKDDQYSYSDLANSGKLTKLENSGGGNTACVAAGTKVMLADGTEKVIENLRKGDLVKSFDHLTGKMTANEVIIVVKIYSKFHQNTLVFDDGSRIVTINEHGLYDLDLNKYVHVDHENYTDYLGHNFVSVDKNGKLGTKKLVGLIHKETSGYKYDIVTEGTLNYVAENTLSVTHVLVDVINSFDFDENMCYDKVKMQADIAKYGLYTYSEWEEYCDVSVFEQYNIPVMKVGISKGLYTKEYIIGLINTYVLDESVQIIAD